MSHEGLQFNNSSEEAIATIKMLMQEANVMGFNDSEIPSLQELIDKLEKKQCTPQWATEQARTILASKQDYH